MVVKSTKFPMTRGGEIDLRAWGKDIASRTNELSAAELKKITSQLSSSSIEFDLELASLLVDLRMDRASILAGLVYRELRTEQPGVEELLSLIGVEAAELVRPVLLMASTSLLEMSNSNLHDSEQESQVENIKRMLVALIDDPRVAVVKLAERVVAIRSAKQYSPERRLRIATEALSIFAPLAGRLGIGQLKWELEDYALRYTQEDTYKQIAAQLRRKRADREVVVATIEGRLRGLLDRHGIDAQVYGRAKHIYSIWRKMRTKAVPFEQVYDVNAFRIVVDDVAQCYAVLGLIHTSWSYLPSEFDDYIANPKENGYQSIHTAVTLENGDMIEVQIRTEAMHAEAELGVCAHWSYKGDDDQSDGFNLKTDWLRQVMEWHEELGGTEKLSTLLHHRAAADRIYVSTPQGHVLDLPPRSTLLDFAYRVHTGVGHACVGGLVNGEAKPIYQELVTSQQVSVVTQEGSFPRRDWLVREFGYVNTDRARAKLVSYFRSLDPAQKQQIGEELLDQALHVLGVVPTSADWQMAVEQFGLVDKQALLASLGGGELDLFDVVDAFIMRSSSRQQLVLPGVAGEESQQRVRLYVRARNRDGLLHELTEVVASLHLPLSATTGRLEHPVSDKSELGQVGRRDEGNAAATDSGEPDAVLSFETSVSSWRQTLKLQSRLRQIPSVYQIGPWARERLSD